ncbi:MAG: DUF4166 domain-containing protein [Pseudomonadota bacterium]
MISAARPQPSPIASSAKRRVVVIGGYGVFGGRLVRRLLDDGRFDVVVAGRSRTKAETFAARVGGTPAELDVTAGSFANRLTALAPWCVVDAAGPFQLTKDSGYPVARAALACKAHYIDLSDDPTFTVQIADLNQAAKAADCVVISGASTVPAISSAALDELTRDLRDVRLVRSFITPGNRAPRGLSVIRAILAQAGQKRRYWRDGAKAADIAWGKVVRRDVGLLNGPTLGTRWASPIGAPDLELFADRYRARSVDFNAGLELSIMHWGLWALTFPVRWGWLKSLNFIARPVRFAATLLYPFGSDRGGMRVDAYGVTADSEARHYRWDLVAEDGDGPEIPAIPAFVAVSKLADGDYAPGARPAVGTMSLAEFTDACKPFAIQSDTQVSGYARVFPTIIGRSFETLPQPVRALHDVIGTRVWVGSARSERGTSLIARTVAWFIGLPPSADETPVTVVMQREGRSETWTRTFGKATFRSTLTPSDEPGFVVERFGALHFTLHLRPDGDRLYYDVKGARAFGVVPLPRWLTPVSETHEFVHQTGEPGFSVRVTLPVGGLLFAYEGRLRPWAAEAGCTQHAIAAK